eukprot:jgi/Botrbrau1/5652/Bobra.55_1s0040.1
MGHPPVLPLLISGIALLVFSSPPSQGIDIPATEIQTEFRLTEPARLPWPQAYRVSFDMKLPYISKIQPVPYVYQWDVYQDLKNSRQKLVRNGLETVITVVELNHTYETFPRISEFACKVLALVPHAGPTTSNGMPGSPGADLLNFVLPDLTDDKWKYKGHATVNGKPSLLYTWPLLEDVGYGEVSASYDFMVDRETGEPVQLLMTGVNLFTGSHYDHWIIDYYNFSAGHIPDAEFEIPEICKNAQALPPKYQASSMLAKARSLFPTRHHGDAEYDAFAHRNGRRHAHEGDYHFRREAYYTTKGMVDRHNARPDASYRMALNRFADWTAEEFESTLFRAREGGPSLAVSGEGLPPEPDPENPPPDVLVHRASVPWQNLPKTVSWRYTGQDFTVKDQATCGACYAFGLVATVEAAYFRQTGKNVRLSEQVFVDCAWDYGNDGCFGGFQDTAARWLIQSGSKLVLSDEYPYAGGMYWCRKDIPSESLIDLSGLQQVWVGGGEKGLMDAVYFKGPVTVNIDVPHAMAYYKEGVFDEPICANSSTPWRILAHAVTVVGYGTTPDGKDYWLVRNSWSTDWGDAGYFKVARQPNDCGITRMGLYVELPEASSTSRDLQESHGSPPQHVQLQRPALQQ